MPRVAALATAALQMHEQTTGRVEALTYYAKATPAAVAVTHAIAKAVIGTYRLSALSPETLLPTDLECRIATAAVTWTPTEYDELTRADGTRWRVIGPIQDGGGYPFWRLPIRQIG